MALTVTCFSRVEIFARIPIQSMNPSALFGKMIVMPHPNDDPVSRKRAGATRGSRAACRRAAGGRRKAPSAGHGAGDVGNPAHARSWTNIRPKCGSPRRLDNNHHAKSTTYYLETDDAPGPANNNRGTRPPPEPGPEPGLGPLPRGLGQFDSAAADPPLTLALIEQNPWNAVELPLPENPPPELLLAAHKAASYCADINNFLMMEAGEGNYSEHWSVEAYKAGEPQTQCSRVSTKHSGFRRHNVSKCLRRSSKCRTPSCARERRCRAPRSARSRCQQRGHFVFAGAGAKGLDRRFAYRAARFHRARMAATLRGGADA